MIKSLLNKLKFKNQKEIIEKTEIPGEIPGEVPIEVDTKPKDNNYIKYYPNGNIKEKGYLNSLGNGIVIIYDEYGNEIEKVKYINGLLLGNQFINKNPLKIADELGLLIDETSDYDNEKADNEFIIDEKIASTFIGGK